MPRPNRMISPVSEVRKVVVWSGLVVVPGERARVSSSMKMGRCRPGLMFMNS